MTNINLNFHDRYSKQSSHPYHFHFRSNNLHHHHLSSSSTPSNPFTARKTERERVVLSTINADRQKSSAPLWDGNESKPVSSPIWRRVAFRNFFFFFFVKHCSRTFFFFFYSSGVLFIQGRISIGEPRERNQDGKADESGEGRVNGASGGTTSRGP